MNDQFISNTTSLNFEKQALDVFRYQAIHCEVYSHYLDLLGVKVEMVTSLKEIPFLPICFFKTKTVYASDKQPDTVFTSSGTTGMETSRHAVADLSMYETSYRKGFQYFYGSPTRYAILALLPSYLERTGSSLIDMVEGLITDSQHESSGFFLHNHEALYQRLLRLQEQAQPTLLIGVSFALLDFAEKYQLHFPELIVMETGGMKGRRRELPRQELHSILGAAFGVKAIHSEYGMTELLSQGYSQGHGLFRTPPWMQIQIRDAQNPLRTVPVSTLGGINVIDLANFYSCSFIETQDLGIVHPNGYFEIVGRFDESDIRGCNLLINE